MTNTRKKRAKAISAKTGMGHRAACNVLNQGLEQKPHPAEPRPVEPPPGHRLTGKLTMEMVHVLVHVSSRSEGGLANNEGVFFTHGEAEDFLRFELPHRREGLQVVSTLSVVERWAHGGSRVWLISQEGPWEIGNYERPPFTEEEIREKALDKLRASLTLQEKHLLMEHVAKEGLRL